MSDYKTNMFFEEQRAKEALAERARLTDDKPSRKQALIALALILLIVLAGIVLFLLLR